MRPDPPQPDTPNTGRVKRHVALIEPGAELKVYRKRQAILVSVGAGVGLALTLGVDIALRVAG